MKAAQLAPDTVLLPVDFDAYRRYSRLFKDAVRAIAPRIQDNGIDEIYIDLTNVISSPRRERPSLQEPDERSVGARATTSRRRSRMPCARRRGSPARSASRRTSCSRRWPPSSTSPTGSRCCARKTSSGASGRCRRARSTASVRSRARSSRRSASGRSASSRRPIPRGSSSTSAARTARCMHDAAHGRDERDVLTEMEPKSISRETTFERDLSAQRDRDAAVGDLHRRCARA